MVPEWQLYERGDGTGVVQKEIRAAKLTGREKVRLRRAMEDFAAGNSLPNDTTYLKRWKLTELRVNARDRWFRLLFVLRDGDALALGLLFTAKDQDTLPDSVFEKAVGRLNDWDARHPR